MPGKYYEYYQQVGDRITPYLTGRRVSIEHRYPGSKGVTFRRHPSGAPTDDWIFVDTPEQVRDWVWQYAEGRPERFPGAREPGPTAPKATLGNLLGLSPGGATVLATLAASASYIAAPAAFRTAVPEANPALSLTAALAVTFPFNIVVGIPLYERMAAALAG